MFQAGIPEKLIQQHTGHRSIDTLQKYERTSESQLLDVSNVILNSGPSDNTTDLLSKCKSMPPSACVSTNSMHSSSNKADSSIILSECTINYCTISINSRENNVNQPCIDDILSELTAEDLFDD